MSSECELRDLGEEETQKNSEKSSEACGKSQVIIPNIRIHKKSSLQSLHRTSSEISRQSTHSGKLSSIDSVHESNGSRMSKTTYAPTSSNTSTHAFHTNSTNYSGIRSGLSDLKPPRPPQPRFHKKDVTDVRQMENALLRLLDDFHSGKLRAFGEKKEFEKMIGLRKNCSMEQMTEIHEQQENLARMHFELGAQQELFVPLSEEGLNQGAENMQSLMENLEKLSLSIEQLHVLNSKSE